jgi:uncharacterized protein
MIKKAFVVFFLSIVAFSHMALADDMTPAKRADIRALLQASGGPNIPQQFAAMASLDIIQKIRHRPDFTPKVGQAIQEEMLGVFNEGMSPTGALSEKIEQVYGKHYTHQEIKDLLAFFRSPIGRKYVGTSVNVSRDVLAAGRAWSESVAPAIQSRLRTRLKKEGFDAAPPKANQDKAPSGQTSPTPAPAK